MDGEEETHLITSHKWRPKTVNVPRKASGEVGDWEDRLCSYTGCGKRRDEHAKSITSIRDREHETWTRYV